MLTRRYTKWGRPFRTGPWQGGFGLWALGSSQKPRAESQEPQKSICALSFTNRGDKTDCGVSHEPVGEYVWL